MFAVTIIRHMEELWDKLYDLHSIMNDECFYDLTIIIAKRFMWQFVFIPV